MLGFETRFFPFEACLRRLLAIFLALDVQSWDDFRTLGELVYPSMNETKARNDGHMLTGDVQE